jgi:hypothetical protein
VTYPAGPDHRSHPLNELGRSGSAQYRPAPGYPAGGPPGPQPAFPGPPQPPSHRSYTKSIVIGAVAVVVLLAVIAGLGAMVYSNRHKLFGGEPAKSMAASSGKPLYHKLPECDSMPKSKLSTLVPAMANTLNNRKAPQDHSEGSYGVCQWDNLEADNKPPNEDRGVEVTMTGYADDVSSGIDSAKSSLASARSNADKTAGKTDGKHTYGSVQELTGLGPGAFAQDFTVQSTWSYGGTELYLQVDNLLVNVSFYGSDGPNGKEKPIAASRTRAGAGDVAREVIAWLSSCADCKS